MTTSQPGGDLTIKFTPSSGGSQFGGSGNPSDNQILFYATVNPATDQLWDTSSGSPPSCSLQQTGWSNAVPATSGAFLTPTDSGSYASQLASYASSLANLGDISYLANVTQAVLLEWDANSLLSDTLVGSSEATLTCTYQGMANGGNNPSNPAEYAFSLATSSDYDIAAGVCPNTGCYQVTPSPSPTPPSTSVKWFGAHRTASLATGENGGDLWIILKPTTALPVGGTVVIGAKFCNSSCSDDSSFFGVSSPSCTVQKMVVYPRRDSVTVSGASVGVQLPNVLTIVLGTAVEAGAFLWISCSNLAANSASPGEVKFNTVTSSDSGLLTDQTGYTVIQSNPSSSCDPPWTPPPSPPGFSGWEAPNSIAASDASPFLGEFQCPSGSTAVYGTPSDPFKCQPTCDAARGYANNPVYSQCQSGIGQCPLYECDGTSSGLKVNELFSSLGTTLGLTFAKIEEVIDYGLQAGEELCILGVDNTTIELDPPITYSNGILVAEAAKPTFKFKVAVQLGLLDQIYFGLPYWTFDSNLKGCPDGFAPAEAICSSDSGSKPSACSQSSGSDLRCFHDATGPRSHACGQQCAEQKCTAQGGSFTQNGNDVHICEISGAAPMSDPRRVVTGRGNCLEGTENSAVFMAQNSGEASARVSFMIGRGTVGNFSSGQLVQGAVDCELKLPSSVLVNPSVDPSGASNLQYGVISATVTWPIQYGSEEVVSHLEYGPVSLTTPPSIIVDETTAAIAYTAPVSSQQYSTFQSGTSLVVNSPQAGDPTTIAFTFRCNAKITSCDTMQLILPGWTLGASPAIAQLSCTSQSSSGSSPSPQTFPLTQRHNAASSTVEWQLDSSAFSSLSAPGTAGGRRLTQSNYPTYPIPTAAVAALLTCQGYEIAAGTECTVTTTNSADMQSSSVPQEKNTEERRVAMTGITIVPETPIELSTATTSPPQAAALVVQTTTFEGLTPEQFTAGQQTYEQGYGTSVNIFNTTSLQFFPGCSVTSTASAAQRRAFWREWRQQQAEARRLGTIGVVGTLSVQFSAQVVQALLEAAKTAAVSLDATTLQGNIAAVDKAKVAAGFDAITIPVVAAVAAPVVVDLGAGAPLTTAPQEIKQIANLGGMTSATWQKGKAEYEQAYGEALNIWTFTDGFSPGCSVTSFGEARGGRSGTLQATYFATVTAAFWNTAKQRAQALSPAQLQAYLVSQAAAANRNLASPSVAYLNPPDFVDDGGYEDKGDWYAWSDNAIITISVGLVGLAVIILAVVVYFVFLKKKPGHVEAPEDASEELLLKLHAAERGDGLADQAETETAPKVHYMLTEVAPAGTKILKINGHDGLMKGDTIVINPRGDNEEEGIIDDFGSIILKEPLKFQHEKDEKIWAQARASSKGVGVSKGPPVVLFPSLAGTVLECEESTLPTWQKKGAKERQRVWMDLGALDIAGWGNKGEGTKIQDTATSYHMETNPFVQHMMLSVRDVNGSSEGGQDFDGIKVRPKNGLEGCEFLAKGVAKSGTVIMGVITNMLTKHGYREFRGKAWDEEDQQSGSMIGASYDWRIMPSQMEKRDQFFTRMMNETEEMVQADPEHRPAHIIGFSLGCKIAKYFLHFCHKVCHDRNDPEWMKRNIAHFIPLGGPFLGSVQLLRAMQVDGAFPPLDMMFSTSQMLTIMRSVPVGRYLQPTGDWHDGLDLPFVFVRHETYVKVRIGQLALGSGYNEENYELQVVAQETRHRRPDEVFSGKAKRHQKAATCKQSFDFHRENPFDESITHALRAGTNNVTFRVSLVPKASPGTQCLAYGGDVLNGYLSLELASVDDALSVDCLLQIGVNDTQAKTPQKAKAMPDSDVNFHSHSPRKQREQAAEVLKGSAAAIVLRVEVQPSDALAKASAADDTSGHPMKRHTGGREVHTTPGCWNHFEAYTWKPAHSLALQNFEELHEYDASEWQVPSPNGLVDDTVAPPVDKVTAIYGVNQLTPRCVFVKHHDMYITGGMQDGLKPPITLDDDADFEGLKVIGGVGFETHDLLQKRPDSGEEVYLSGDGTVNYQSLRWAGTWRNQCEVEIYELPGCDHRGASSDARMLGALRKILGLESHSYLDFDDLDTEVAKLANNRYTKRAEHIQDSTMCGVVAKFGSKKFRKFHKFTNCTVLALALTACAISLLVLVVGSSMDWDTIAHFAWGTGHITVFDQARQDLLWNSGQLKTKITTPYEFNLGLMTMANLGGGEMPHRTSWRMKQVAELMQYPSLQSCQISNLTALSQHFFLENMPVAAQDPETTFTQTCQAIPGLLTPGGATYAKVDCQNSATPVLNVYRNSGCTTVTQTLTASSTGCTAIQFAGGQVQALKLSCETGNHTMRYPASATNAWDIWQNSAIPRVQVTSSAGANYGRFWQSNGQGLLLQGASHCISYKCVGWGPPPEAGDKNQVSALAVNNHTFQVHEQIHTTKSCASPILATEIINSSKANVPLTEGVIWAINNPYTFTTAGGSYIQLTCPDVGNGAFLFNPPNVPSQGYEVAEKACVIAFDQCEERASDIYMDCTVEPKMIDLCVNCYDAGVFAYTVMCITFAFQLPLVYLAFLRVNPFADSRCAKFWTIPLACLVTILSVIVEIWWIQGCSDKFSDGVLEYVAIQAITGQAGVLETYAEFEWGLNVCAYLPLISAGCTCAIMLLNCFTPVPEFFMGEWADPPLEVHNNSLETEAHDVQPEVLEPLVPDEQPVVVPVSPSAVNLSTKEIEGPEVELLPLATAVEASQEEATPTSSAVPDAPGSPPSPAAAAPGSPSVPAAAAPGSPPSPAAAAPGSPSVPAAAAPGSPPSPAAAAPGSPSVPAAAAPGSPSVPAAAAPGSPSVSAAAAPGSPSVPAAAAPGSPSVPAAAAPGSPSQFV